MTMDPKPLIEAFGTLGIFAIVFAESGLLFGFFLPGDSLLFTAGLLASQGTLNFPLIVTGCFVAAVVGDQVGYYIGRRAGPAIFRRPDSRFFKQKNVDRAKAYFEIHGSKTIVLARFIPIVRTFAPVVAGVAQMDYRRFVTFNVIGGFLWAVGDHDPRLRPGQHHPRHRQVPAPDHRAHRRRVVRAGDPRVLEDAAGVEGQGRGPGPADGRGRGALTAGQSTQADARVASAVRWEGAACSSGCSVRWRCSTDGRPLDLGPRMPRAVLALLVMSVNRVVSLDRLIDQLWGDAPPPTAATAVQGYVSGLRRALEPGRAPRTPAQVLVTHAPGYVLRAPADAVDAVRFEAMTSAGLAELSRGRPEAGGRGPAGRAGALAGRPVRRSGLRVVRPGRDRPPGRAPDVCRRGPGRGRAGAGRPRRRLVRPRAARRSPSLSASGAGSCWPWPTTAAGASPMLSGP